MCKSRLLVFKPLSPYLSHIIFLLVWAYLTLEGEIRRLLKANPMTPLVLQMGNVPDGQWVAEEKG